MGLPCNSALGVLVLTAIAVASAPTAVLANGPMPIDGTFAVSFMAPSAEAPNYCAINGTSGTAIEAQGIGKMSGPLGPLFLTIKKCRSGNTYAGAFTMTAGNGARLSGTYAGTHDSVGANGFGSFHGTLTVTEGTGRFRHARGVLSFTAVGSPASTGATPNTVNGAAYYLVQGNMLSR